MHPGLQKSYPAFLSLELPARRNVGVHVNRKQVTVNDLLNGHDETQQEGSGKRMTEPSCKDLRP
jgi:hypothetical protein